MFELITRDQIKQSLANEQFLCACKYCHDTDLQQKFNIVACETCFKYLSEQLENMSLYDFKVWLRGFIASEYIKSFNDKLISDGFKCSIILMTATQDANIDFLFNRYKQMII